MTYGMILGVENMCPAFPGCAAGAAVPRELELLLLLPLNAAPELPTATEKV
jgi:hypothetical protein